MSDKRFNRVGGYVYDGEKCISHFEDVKHRDDIVTLLNELHEETQDLECKLAEKHQDLTELGLKYDDIIDIKIANEVIDNQRNTIKELSEENEQLKQQLNRLKTINEVKRETIKFHVDGYNRLKQSILEAYETERTELGKSVLKQLLEQLQ